MRANILILFLSFFDLLIADGIIRVVGYTDKVSQFYLTGKKIRSYISITQDEVEKINE